MIKVREFTGFYVEHDEEEYKTDGRGNWELRMGESWESWYDCADIERKFRRWHRIKYE